MVANGHVWLLRLRNVSSVIKQLHFKSYESLISLNLDRCMWRVAVALGSVAVDENLHNFPGDIGLRQNTTNLCFLNNSISEKKSSKCLHFSEFSFGKIS